MSLNLTLKAGIASVTLGLLAVPVTAQTQTLTPLVLAEDEDLDTATRDGLRNVLSDTARGVSEVARGLELAKNQLVVCLNDVVGVDGDANSLAADQCAVNERIASQQELLRLTALVADTSVALRDTAAQYSEHIMEVQARVDAHAAERGDLEVKQDGYEEAGRQIKRFQAEGGEMTPEQLREARRIAHEYERNKSRMSALNTIVEFHLAEQDLYRSTQRNIHSAANALENESMAFHTAALDAENFIEIAHAKARHRGSYALVIAAQADWEGLTEGLGILEVALAELEENRPRIGLEEGPSSEKLDDWDVTRNDPVLMDFLAGIEVSDEEVN